MEDNEEYVNKRKRSKFRYQVILVVFIVIGVLLALYLLFGLGSLPDSVIWACLCIDFCYIVYLLKELEYYKDLKESKEDKQWNEGEFTGNLTDAIKNYSQVKFSKKTEVMTQRILNQVAFNQKTYRKAQINMNSFLNETDRDIDEGLHKLGESSWNMKESLDLGNSSSLDNLELDWTNKAKTVKKKGRLPYKKKQFIKVNRNVNNQNTIKRDSNFLINKSLRKSRNSSLKRIPDKLSMSKESMNKISISKASLIKTSKKRSMSIHQRDMLRDSSVMERQKNEFFFKIEGLKVDFRKFNTWVSYEIQKWMSHWLIPELIQRNQENLEKIDSELYYFGLTLKEKKELSALFDSLHMKPVLQDLDQSSIYLEEKKKLKPVSLDEIMSYSLKRLKQWGGNWQDHFFDHNDLITQFAKLDKLLAERDQLDSYLDIKGFKIEETRVYLLQRLFQLQKDNFAIEINQLEDLQDPYYPSDKDLLLNVFINCVKENDRYYSLDNFANKNVFINEFLEFSKRSELDFLILKSTNENIKLYCGPIELNSVFDMQMCFTVMTLFTHHILTFHEKHLASGKNNAFEMLTKIFDIKKKSF